MIDSLRAKLVSVCKSVCQIVLSEDEAEGYPYAVYDMTTVPMFDKDGVCAFSGDCKIRVVSDKKNEADTTAIALQAAIAAQMRSSAFFSRLDDVTKDCVDNLWIIEHNYTLKQYADWSEPAEAQN